MKYLLLLLLVSSCSSVKNSYETPIKEFVNNPELKKQIINHRLRLLSLPKHNSEFKEHDTTFVTTELNNNFDLKEFYIPWDLGDKKYSNIKAHFIDSTKAFLLNEEDIKKIKTVAEQDTLPKKVTNFIISNKNKSVLKLASLYETLRKKRTVYYSPPKKRRLIYVLSRPIFIRNNKIALFGFAVYPSDWDNYSPPFYKERMIIMKKEKKKWIYIGYVIARKTVKYPENFKVN